MTEDGSLTLVRPRKVVSLVEAGGALAIANAIYAALGLETPPPDAGVPVMLIETQFSYITHVAVVEDANGRKSIWIGDAQDGLVEGNSPPDQAGEPVSTQEPEHSAEDQAEHDARNAEMAARTRAERDADDAEWDAAAEKAVSEHEEKLAAERAQAADAAE